MKIFTKVMLIIAGVFASIGVVCMVIAFCMGLTPAYLKEMVEDGKFSFDAADGKLSIFDIKEGLIIKFDNEDDLDYDIQEETSTEEEESNVSEIEKNCKNLDIEFGAGILDIHYSDVEYIQVQKTNIPNLKVSVKNNTLVIREGADIHVDLDDVEDRSLTILIPKDMKFEEVELEIGASKADIENILANEISITVGAGQANISKITAKKFDLEVGAGQATAVQLDVQKLEVEAGVGQVNIALNGVQEEYNYNVECGIGKIMVGTSSYSGLGSEEKVKYDGATKEINVECGIGEVKIKFQD